MTRIRDTVNKLVRIHGTNDPFRIAEEKGIYVIEEDLGEEIFGYYNKLFNIRMIHINCFLSTELKRFTCGHELGHCVLHPNEATPALSRTTIASKLKTEREANEFSSCLLMDGSHAGYHIDTKQGVLDYYGLPKEMERFIQQ